MLVKQSTILKPVNISGRGLHTGVEVVMTVLPAPAGHGYKFKRVDLESAPIVAALVDNVVDTSRGTTVEEKGVRVSTIEHLMAALFSLRIDNVLIEINGPEVPIMDGSSREHMAVLSLAGRVELEETKRIFDIKERVVYADEARGVEIAVYPDDHFSVDVMIDYNSKVLGHQFATLGTLDDFGTQIAPARTFVFLHELEVLQKHNLIKGGDLDNAIVIMDRAVNQEELDRLATLFSKPKIQVRPEGVLNNLQLHFENEPARHKLLDLIGDLSLVGHSFNGRIVATRPGHLANTELGKMLRMVIKKEIMKGDVPVYDPREAPVYTIEDIKRMLPHRPPFLLVDKIISKTDTSIVGIKNVTMNEPFFVGHFPDEPVMPGVLQIEAMAQCGGLLVLSGVPDPENYITYFLKVDKVRFKKKVVPGDTLIFKLEMLGEVRRGIVTMVGQAFVGDTVVMEGEMMAQIVKTKK